MIVTVGRIARAHGVRGEVVVDVRTDTPDERFVVGTRLATEPPQAGPLTVEAGRWHSGRLLVRFAGIMDRTAAELLRGVRLLAEIGADETPDDPEEFFDHQLEGLRVVTVDGTVVGVVAEVIHAPGQDLLAVRRLDDDRPDEDRGDGKRADDEERGEVLVPFVAEIVPEIDIAAGRIVIDPPHGLLDPAEAEEAR